jgi:site-specific DNA-methyltransferase (adenine-specific)
MEINKIYNENCLDTMARMPDGFIDLTVTSPPYDNLRDYKGYCFDFENVAKELFRVTKQGGVVVWVVADETKAFCESLSSFKQAIFFVESCGFNLLDTMIYHKSNYAPAYPTLRRYANTFEYMFVFSKGKPKTFNPIQQDKVVLFSKTRLGKYRQKDGSVVKKTMKVDTGRLTKDAENVWTICPTKSKGAGNHPAVFPEQLVIDHIISWSNENELVYDPFMGSGTTAKMALLNNRKFVGSEISKEYCEIAEKRINENL